LEFDGSAIASGSACDQQNTLLYLSDERGAQETFQGHSPGLKGLDGEQVGDVKLAVGWQRR